MKRPNPFILLLALACLTSPSMAWFPPADTAVVRGAETELVYRNFESLGEVERLTPPADPILINDSMLPDTVIDKRAHAHMLLQQVLHAQRFLESLDALSEIDLPVGIVRSGGQLDYSILIDRLSFTREGALMDVYASLALPQSSTRLAFHGVIPLSAEGGIAGNAKIFLLGDHTILANNTTQVTLKGSDRSYVEFDCTGFLGVNIDAEIQFSKDLFVPEDESGEVIDERLKVSFTTYTQTLHDILIRLTLPPFQVTTLPGFGFHVSEAYLDWSDLANPPTIIFPESYSSPLIEAGLTNLWRGIHLEEIEVRMPHAFARRNMTQRVAVGAHQMIIDDLGLTGEVYVENIFSDGDMNGWKYSLDVLSLGLVTNRISGLKLVGKLTIPVVKNKDGRITEFNYVAQRSPEGDYMFSVAVEDDLKLDLWVADLKLMRGSSVTVTERNRNFYPSAHLNGELTIKITSKGPKAVFNSIRFENMVINSEAPYFQPGTFGFGSEGHSSSVAGYPVVFDNIGLKSDEIRTGIAFDLLINLSGKPEDGSFAGKAGIVIWGIQDNEPERGPDGKIISLDHYSWKFDKVELTSVKINIKKPKVIELTGEVRFYDGDKIYGEGFKGSLRGLIHTVKAETQALFGKTDTYRYWYADALVELKTGIPMIPGVLSAFGFGGGYYSKMKQSDAPIDGTLGRSPSGITYVPDENTNGIRAIVLIGTPRPEAMRGDVALEVSLNRHGGINSATFTGNANFMSVASTGAKEIREMVSAAVTGKLTEKLSSLTKGQVFGSMKLHFDNTNDVFHGNLEIYVNVAGGIVRGVSPGNKAGWAVLHFEKNDWYVHIGTPDQPLGLDVARIFKAKSYFMLGKNLPGSPPPPQQVSEILGSVDMDYMRDLNALESGMGIAFGLHFLVDTGDLQFLMFYGRFSAGTGLDFMLKDYGSNFHCAETSGPIGINGWYANGQAYAFITGKIGVKINLRFYKGKYEILSIGAAAILQAKGPNPFWMKGQVGGYYRILGGMVKGRCKFEVTVGQECTPVREQNLLEEVNIIAEMTPANYSSDVSVFNTPQVAFNIPVGEVFEIKDLDKSTHYFRAVLEEFVLLDDTRKIPGIIEWNETKDVAVFDAHELLPGEKKLMASVKLTFEEMVNGRWSKVKFDGKIVAETAETTFDTGSAPGNIPENNIAWSYPVQGQFNFYPKEFSQGLIQLRDGQSYLFNSGADWIQKIRMSDVSTGQELETDLSYDPQLRRIIFKIPDGLHNGTTYHLQIINVPKNLRSVDHNVATVERKIKLDEGAGNATLTTRSADGDRAALSTQEIFSSVFRTSRHNTFVEKMRNTSSSPAMRLSAGINIFQLSAQLKGEEFFDYAEAGSTSDLKLVRMEAVLDDNRWYNDHVYPLVYEGYPLMGWMKVRRPDPENLGIPPVRDIYIANINRGTSVHRNDHPIASVPFTNELLVYNVGSSVARDFSDLQHHAVNYAVDNPGHITPRLESLIVRPLPHLRFGPYLVRFNYVIPGINQTTSSYEIEIYNRVPDND